MNDRRAIVASQSAWSDRLRRLLDDHPESPGKAWEFPEKWTASGVWR